LRRLKLPFPLTLALSRKGRGSLVLTPALTREGRGSLVLTALSDI